MWRGGNITPARKATRLVARNDDDEYADSCEGLYDVDNYRGSPSCCREAVKIKVLLTWWRWENVVGGNITPGREATRLFASNSDDEYGDSCKGLNEVVITSAYLVAIVAK